MGRQLSGPDHDRCAAHVRIGGHRHLAVAYGGISKNTVKTHLNHIYAKTKTANREELLELLESVDAG